MKRNAMTYLSRDEIRALTAPSNVRGVASVAVSWGLIAFSFALLAAFPNRAWAWAVSLVLLGGRQLGLAILMHECSHRSLFRSRWANELVGTWLCAAPVWQRLSDYREHHLAHHAHTSLDGDTDLGLVEPFPCTRRSLLRKLARDLAGLTFVRRIVGLVLMDAGVLTYSASLGQRRVVPRPTLPAMLKNLARNTGPVLITNGALYAALALSGHGVLYLAWVIANASTFSLFVRIRAISEHAALPRTDDPFHNTRTTRANLLARLTVAPHHVNYHLEHHLLPTVPHYHLPALHALLEARGAYTDAQQAPGYLSVLSYASAPQLAS